MNAGAMGGETFDCVRSVRVADSQGAIVAKTPADLEIHYRNVPSLRTQYVVAATFEGRERPAEEIARLLDESMHKRRTSQPRESSAGCIFKNPAACPAGKLVDELGLKNSHVGGARVSDVHGNFIVNDGNATAADVLELIGRVKAAALETRGITLETEVQILGETEPFLLS
jgi:UDP-N-acetylenolpyruvoylglucosamine reductase